VNDRERWDTKYAGAFGSKRTEPNEYVVEWAAGLEGRGRALDLAAGTGRHALHLAQTGWESSAWDVSPVGLEILTVRARELGVEVATRAVDVLTESLDESELGFDLVICVLFLDRSLFNELHRFVAPGGHLIFSTATEDFSGDKPPSRFRLQRGELERGVPGFETVKSVEAGGMAGILARRSHRS